MAKSMVTIVNLCTMVKTWIIAKILITCRPSQVHNICIRIYLLIVWNKYFIFNIIINIHMYIFFPMSSKNLTTYSFQVRKNYIIVIILSTVLYWAYRSLDLNFIIIQKLLHPSLILSLFITRDIIYHYFIYELPQYFNQVV